jgi:hypothetical protein
MNAIVDLHVRGVRGKRRGSGESYAGREKFFFLLVCAVEIEEEKNASYRERI